MANAKPVRMGAPSKPAPKRDTATPVRWRIGMPRPEEAPKKKKAPAKKKTTTTDNIQPPVRRFDA